MKKILTFLSVLALLVSFGMAFSVTGEFFTKFAKDSDTWMSLNFDAFSFKYSFDTASPAPLSWMTVLSESYDTNGAAAGGIVTYNVLPTQAVGNLGLYDFTGFKVSDALTVGLKFGVTGFGYHMATTATNITWNGLAVGGLTNAGDVGFLGMEFDPHIAFILGDNMTLSDKDLVIQYWSYNRKYTDNFGTTNNAGADNALPKIGIGAALEYKMSDSLVLTPGASFTMVELDSHNVDIGNTNTYKDGNNTINLYGTTVLSADAYKFKIAPIFQIYTVNNNDITANTTTNTLTGSAMKLTAFLGEGKVVANANGTPLFSDGDPKWTKDDDKKLRSYKLSDQMTINPYFGFETLLSASYVNLGNTSTNNYTQSEFFVAIGGDSITYKIDDTYDIDAKALYSIYNTGTLNNANNVAGTNSMQTNTTTMIIGGNLNIHIAPNAVIHAGTTLSSYSIVYDLKDPATQTNVITINHSGLADPTLELGGEVTVGDFAIKGVIKSQLLLNTASDTTNGAPTSGTGMGGNIASSSQGFDKVFGDLFITYTKDNGHFKLKFTGGTAKEAEPLMGAEVGYKF